MSSITQLICNNFGGIRQHNSRFDSELITAQDMQNVELYSTSFGGVGIRTQKGNYPALELPENEKIVGLFSSTQGLNNHIYIHTETDTVGKLYLYDIETSTLQTVKENLTLQGISNALDITQGWSDLFVFTNGVDFFNVSITITEATEDTPKSIATTVTDMSTLKDVEERLVHGIGLANFDGRLWVFYDEVLWHSVKGDIMDFHTLDTGVVTTAGYMEFSKKITAVANYLGSLAVFHKDSSELVSVDSDSSFSRGDESPGGCASFNSLVFHGTELYFYDDTKKSIFSFKQVVNGDKTLSDNYAVEIQDLFLNSIKKADLDKIRALSVIIEDHNEIWFLIPSDDENYSTIIIFDYLRAEWVKRKSQKINCFCVAESILYSGSEKGKLLHEYYNYNEHYTFDGEFIQHYFNASPFILGEMNTLKVLKFPPRVTLDLPYDNDFYVDYIKNFDTLKNPKVKHITTKYKNTMVWDESNWTEELWLPLEMNVIEKFPNATFKALEMNIYTQEKGQNFAIRNMELSKIKVKQV